MKILDNISIQEEQLNFPQEKVKVWSFSGGAVKWISLAEGAKVAINKIGFPEFVIGVSAGALLAPIIAVSKHLPCVLDKAIEIGSTLETEDMFPYKNNQPFNKKGKPTTNAIFRVLTGHNHLGWQDIGPLYKQVFTDEVFQVFKKSQIKCYAFGVKGKNFSPKVVCLNNAKDIDELIQMIELSSRITPFVQPAIYKNESYSDGGFIAMNAAWILAPYLNISELITFYTNLPLTKLSENKNHDKNFFQVTGNNLNGAVYWHSVKDRIIEQLYCLAHNIKYIRIDYPCSAIDEVYDTDEDQLRKVGKESREITRKRLENY